MSNVEYRVTVTKITCALHGERDDFLMVKAGSGMKAICPIPNCHGHIEVQTRPDRTDIIQGLRTLLRCLCHGTIDAGYNAIEVTARSRKARVTHVIDKGELWVTKVSPFGHAERENHKFELSDPRSVGAAIRCLCRLTGQDMPSFDSIDRVLDEGPPAWMLED